MARITYARKSRKYTRKTTSRRLYKKAIRRSNRKFALRVKRVIHRISEKKVQSVPIANNSINYASAALNPTILSLMPTPTVGTSVQQRIGNQIMVTKSTIRGFVNLLPYNATTNALVSPIKVKMWLCARSKSNRGVSGLPIATDFANFFQSGSTSLGFQSNVLDMMLHSNKDYWTVYSTKQFELSYQIGGINSNQSGYLQPPSGKVSVPFSFNLTKRLGKLKYNDDGLYPTNKELYLVIQTVRADGQTDAAGTTYAEYHAVVEHRYEDN